MRLCVCSAVDWTTHRSSAGEFCGCQLRTPKEQYLSVNLSGTRTARDYDASWKAVATPGGPHPPMGKGDSPDGGQSRRISQAPGVQVKTEGEGR